MENKKKENERNLLSKVKEKSTSTISKATSISKKAITTVGDTTSEKVKNIKNSFGEKNQQKTDARTQDVKFAMQELSDTIAEKILALLGNSLTELNVKHVTHIKNSFPIPREQCILWADAKFGLKPSGIVITNAGVFIKTDVTVFKKKTDNDNERKSELFYYRWDNFELDFFTENNDENNLLPTENKGYLDFVNACKKLTASSNVDNSLYYSDVSTVDSKEDYQVSKVAPTAFAGVVSSEKAVFTEQKARRDNYHAGHGEMAEEALTYLDKLFGNDATVVGRDNTKDGADRLVNGVFIQTKYYKSAIGSIDACFASNNGNYRYINNDGTPMQLEVPKDQYEKALSRFKYKIETGKVPGVTDPNEAEKIVRKGRLTYQQAVNLTKPGTIESLAYDAATGAVTCSCVFGISFVTTMFITWKSTKDINEAIIAGATAGIQVFGIAFIQHMLASQISRTSLAGTLIRPSQFIVERIGYKTSATLVNGIRALSGKAPIYGVAASKHLAKILRSNMLTSVIAFAIFSVPETYKLFSRKTSNAQYIKNMSSLAISIATGAGGAAAAGLAASKVAAVIGTAVSPVVGTAVGFIGGFCAGVGGAAAANAVGNIIRENDSEINGRLFNAVTSCEINEYLLDEKEIEKFIKVMDAVSKKELRKLLENIQASDKQEAVIREFLKDKLDKIVSNREHFNLPSDEELDTAFSQLESSLSCE